MLNAGRCNCNKINKIVDMWLFSLVKEPIRCKGVLGKTRS